MNTYVLWIEMDKAKVFKIKIDGPVLKTLRRRQIRHHLSNEPENNKNCEKFFHEIADSVKDANEILLMGPSLAKDHFKSFLTKHHHLGLADKVVGTLTLDIQSDPRLLAHSRDFFTKYDAFTTSASV